MAETGAIRAGGAFVEIFAKDAKLMKSLSASSAKFKAWGASMVAIGTKVAGAGVAATAALFGTLKVFADQGGAINDMAGRTGVAVEALQQLGYAADQTGSSMEDVEKALRFMQKAGSTGTLEEIMAIADELNAIDDPGKKAARAMELFGKAGTGLLPMLEGGADGLRKYIDRANELGIVHDASTVKAADDFGDAMGDVAKQVKAAAFQIGAALEPQTRSLIARFQESLSATIQWVREHRGLVSVALQAAAGVTALGVSMVVAGYALKAASVAIAGVSLALGALTNPLAIVAAGVAAMGAAVLKESGAFEQLGKDASAAIEGIKAALMDGDMGKAAGILWKLVQLEFQRGIHAVQSTWFAFVDTLELAWVNLSESIRSITSGLFEGMGNIFTKIARNVGMNVTEIGNMVGLIDDTTRNRLSNEFEGNANKEMRARAAEAQARRKKIADDAQRRREEIVGRAELESSAIDAAMAELQSATREVQKTFRPETIAGYVDSASQAGGPGGLGYKGQPGQPDIEEIVRSMSTRGIFNPRALQSLQGSRDNAQKPVEKKLEQVVEVIGQQTIVLETIEQNTRNSSMEFE